MIGRSAQGIAREIQGRSSGLSSLKSVASYLIESIPGSLCYGFFFFNKEGDFAVVKDVMKEIIPNLDKAQVRRRALSHCF